MIGDEYIKRIDAIRAFEVEDYDVFTKDGDDGYSFQNAIRILYEVPRVDVQVVKRGKWALRGGTFHCSVCGKKALWFDSGGTGGFSREFRSEQSNFCPNCGALMEVYDA